MVPNGLAGIKLGGPDDPIPWLRRIVMTGNRISELIGVPIDRSATVPFVAIGGNPEDRAIYEGAAAPGGLVAAPPGSLYVQISPSGPPALYLKAEGSGASGWIQLG